MSKKPPNRPGIAFEVGARVEARDYLQKWYPSRIEKLDYEEGKMLVHFDRWSHRYDEWIFWDSNRLRPFERPVLQKDGLEEEEVAEEEEEGVEEEQSESLSEMRPSRLREHPGCTASTEDQTELQQSKQVLRSGEEVLARWTDCRYYPAKVESVSKEGTYTVQFYDGVIRCVKRMHIKSMPEDAKGQDWIALVKAATAAAKNKGACKPRTSANSNKDKEERRAGRASPGKEGESASLEEMQDAQEAVEEPGPTEKLDKTDASIEAEQPEPVKGKRKKSNQGSSFQAKRARLNKITGLLVSKVAYEDEHENKEKKSEVPQISEKEPSASTEDQEKTDTEAASSSPPIQKHVLPSATPPAPVKSRNRRLKHDSGESTGSHKQSKSSCTVSQAEESTPAAESVSAPTPTPAPTPSAADTPQTALPLPTPASPPRPSEKSQRRRRSQRLATFIPDPFCEPLHSLPSATDGKRLAQKPESQQDLPVTEVLDTTSVPPEEEPELPLDLSKSATVAATPPPPAPSVPPPQPPETDKEESPPLKTPADVKTASPTTAAVLKGVPKPLKPNKHAREPTLSSHVHALQLESPLSTGLKPSKCSKKKRSSASLSSDGTDAQFPVPPREKGFESLHEKILKRVIEKDKHAEPGILRSEKKIKLEEKSQPIGKKKDKDKERKEKKEKDPFKVKQKKKKKKKKKSKQHNYSDFEDISLAFLERCTSPVTRSSGNSLAQRNTSSSKHTSFQYPRAILSVDLTGENLSDIDFLEDSSTESLLLSGDEYNQDFDSFNLEDSQDEDDAANEIVRCICEMDEENGFMIQCEECMCWQHSVCMGLLEDSIPEQYICYVCRDPPGQRWSAKYRHDKDWLNKGHMYGLSFLSENYSHQNAKNIVSTHQLLADVYSVKKALRGLQLKMDILQNKHNPNLHLWARSWVNPDEEQPMGGFPECIHHQARIADCINHNSNQKAEDTYITSEHSYQKPSGFGLEHNTAADFMSSDGEDAVRLDEEPEAMSEVGTNSVPKEQQESTEIASSEVLNENTADEVESDDQARTLLQWQVNLLTHIDGVQNQVAGRMDLIEKELDVLESWLDFTGELEPPEPLARLPQLKRRIKQLLTDLGKVQQMSTLCSV
ncbi:PHD finger protein 20-like protein 1 isoform X3 [Acipenser ruthenus]|uniref:PHD finger protein 20-like protein 1 isoform X3 n=1 Tax=Acipenser ruthenus TaxID=7906 RepID=UPI0027426196|nr:PHD finger protein 20-like protein 1 isoform X3 [Acipenser ruthenus]